MTEVNTTGMHAKAIQSALKETTYYFVRDPTCLWHVAILDFDPQLQVRRWKQTKEPEDDVEIKHKLYKVGDKEFNRNQRSKLCKVSELGQKIANIEVRPPPPPPPPHNPNATIGLY